MEFFDRAVEINDAEVDDEIIDEGLRLVRTMWNAGGGAGPQTPAAGGVSGIGRRGCWDGYQGGAGQPVEPGG